MTPPAEPSLGKVFASVSADLRSLAYHTLALAKLELNNALSTVAWSAAGALVALLVALAGLAVLVSALVLIAIALGLPAWGAALLVGTLLTLAGAGGALYCVRNLRHAQLTLKETRDSLKETVAWLKHEAIR